MWTLRGQGPMHAVVTARSARGFRPRPRPAREGVYAQGGGPGEQVRLDRGGAALSSENSTPVPSRGRKAGGRQWERPSSPMAAGRAGPRDRGHGPGCRSGRGRGLGGLWPPPGFCPRGAAPRGTRAADGDGVERAVPMREGITRSPLGLRVPGTGYGFGGRFVGGMPGEFGEIMGSVRREPGHRRCVFQEPDDPGCASRNLSCGGRRVTATRLGRGGVVVPARRRAPTRRHHGHGPCPAKKPGGIGTDGRLQGLRIGRSAELPRAGRYLDIENENSCQECGAVRGVPLLRRPDSPWADGGAVTECGRKISFSGTNRANNKSLTFSRVGSLSITS